MAEIKSKVILRNASNSGNTISKRNLTSLFVHVTILGLYFFTGIAHKVVLDRTNGEKKSLEALKPLKSFRHYFFTGWNFALQIVFLLLAVTDEVSKLAGLAKLQKTIEKLRLFLFSTLIFPSSLLVMSIFWGIWHIDRELIFPKAIDDFYPSWLNHTLHTLIVVPLIVEILVFKSSKPKISRRTSAIVLITYCCIYQTLYLSIYIRHGVWLYPVYKVMTWTQRAFFILGQFFLILAYQQIGIFLLLKSEKTAKIKAK